MQAKRASRRIRYVASGKENACPSEVDEGRVLNKSPLPIGYPRIPLQDITDIISPESNLLSNEAGSSRKPMKTKGRKKGSSDLRQSLQPVQIDNEPRTTVDNELKVEVTKSPKSVKETGESQTTQNSSDPPIPKKRKQPQGTSRAKSSSSNIMKFR
ncbi:hypothetical protein O6H91_20G072900 [Diphasiastrum complanatum]|uniref:Uncharacterized protein n=1 Tax=Diphasiastrum complanatum TaxID=34168 RepID=A0ACC2ARX7_DIPCM|nr:hypothetical protein O6H91_20G072900 [Diphasiastrum complanatum]